MSELLATHSVTCPHCWEQIEILVDRSVSEQQYVEDCAVCCHPILLTVKVHGEEDVEIGVEATE